MRVSHRHKFVFLAFPKTGSESVRLALGPISDEKAGYGAFEGIDEHTPPLLIEPVFVSHGWAFDEYFRFVFVRNPWTRLVSLYRMVKRHYPAFDWSFERWVVSTRTDGEGGGAGGWDTPTFLRYGTYTLDNFVCDRHGKRLVDHVFRMEDMPLIPDELRRRGIPVKSAFMPGRNIGSPVDMNAFYPPGLRALVAMRYAKDIAEFDYRYPGL